MLENKNPKNKKKQLKGYARFSSLTIQMAIIICLGVLFGGWIENKTPHSNGLIQALISLLAVCLSIWLVVKEVLKNQQK